MRIEALQYIMVIAETGSISRAAEKISIQKTSLSSALLAAEKELGYPLFSRSAGGVTLTERGKEAMGIIGEIVSRYNNLMSLSSPEKGILRVSVNYSIAELFFAEIYGKLYYTLPELQLRTYRIHPETFLRSRTAKDSPREIAIDCYVTAEMEEAYAMAEAGGYRITPLNEFSLMAYINRKNPLSRREAVTPEELKGKKVLFGVDPHVAVPERPLPFGADFKVMDGASFIPLLQLVNNSDTIAVLPEYKNLPFSQVFDDYTQVVPVPFTGPVLREITYTQCLITPGRARFSPDEKALLELIKAVIKD